MDKLEIQSLLKKYGELRAVDEVSLNIEEGELTSILGPSGCGKSTLLSCIAGIEKPDSGRITVDDEVFSCSASGMFLPPDRRRIGFVFQSYGLWPHMNVAQHLAYPLKMRKVDREGRKTAVNKMLGMIRLEAKKLSYPSQLSGGEQQRVALGRAMIMNPRLLLLDEPLSNLDAGLREEMQQQIRDLQQKLGLTVIHVTHDQAEALSFSDRVVVMNQGKIVRTALPRELYEDPGDVFTAGFVGVNNLIPGKILRREHGGHGEGRHRCRRVSCPEAGFSAVRPEDICLFAEPKKDRVPDGKGVVVRRIFKGTHFLYTLKTEDGRELKVQTHVSEIHEPGTTLYYRIRRCTYLAQS